jgi:LmbE family N-acetylglucosaminyl deacetylase
VFSCGKLLARYPGSIVVTVFAGVPSGHEPVTAWDAAAGFDNARESVSARREEDRSALERLSALPIWLDFPDAQYNATPSLEALIRALGNLIESIQPATILFPAGLYHSDHVLVHQALISIYPQFSDKAWLMYEDALYRRSPGILQRRLIDLMHSGIQVTPIPSDNNSEADMKNEAIHCYGSQLRALNYSGGNLDAFSPERYWQLQPTADGALSESAQSTSATAKPTASYNVV